MADIPAGTGLGSSGSFTVGVLQALARPQARARVEPSCSPRRHAHIEIDRLASRSGSRTSTSPRSAASPRSSSSPTTASVSQPLRSPPKPANASTTTCSSSTRACRRSASDVLAVETDSRDAGAARSRRRTSMRSRRSAARPYDALEARRSRRSSAHSLTAQWELKYERSPTPVHERVDTLDPRRHRRRRAAAASSSARGAAGFLLFYADEKARLRGRWPHEGLDEVRFGIDYQGATVDRRTMTAPGRRPRRRPRHPPRRRHRRRLPEGARARRWAPVHRLEARRARRGGVTRRVVPRRPPRRRGGGPRR